MNTQSEINAALLDVRKAYRLLHDYQRAALDAASYIGNRLGFTYQGGYPRFANSSPKDGHGRLGLSAWDWLNLYFYEFHFMKQETEATHIHFCILLFSDTGYFLNETVAPDRDDPGTYLPAVQSETKVGLIFYRSWFAEYDSLFYDRKQAREFLAEEKLAPLLIDGGVRGMVRDFSCLASQETTDQLVRELIEFGESEKFLIHEASTSLSNGH